MNNSVDKQIKRLEEYTRLNLRLPNTHTEKLKMIKLKILIPKCSICSIDSWNHQDLSLHLDHIDGNPTNNLIYNLRLLCPNCHSQTSTYCGKNNKGNKVAKIKPRCIDCNVVVSTTWTQRCLQCRNSLNELKNLWPENELFEQMVKTRKSMEDLAKQLGVSSNSIRKRCKKLSIEY